MEDGVVGAVTAGLGVVLRDLFPRPPVAYPSFSPSNGRLPPERLGRVRNGDSWLLYSENPELF